MFWRIIIANADNPIWYDKNSYWGGTSTSDGRIWIKLSAGLNA